jgi:hypothetical protein
MVRENNGQDYTLYDNSQRREEQNNDFMKKFKITPEMNLETELLGKEVHFIDTKRTCDLGYCDEITKTYPLAKIV